MARSQDTLDTRIPLLVDACREGASVACGDWALEVVRGQPENREALARATAIYRYTCDDDQTHFCVGAMKLYLALPSPELERAANWASRGCHHGADPESFCMMTLELREALGDRVDEDALAYARSEFSRRYYANLQDYAHYDVVERARSYFNDTAP